eukprot:TRINITY_DN34383_c1_g1_i1.p1 TRINITY_DN34383_c1_g1~~TRINITY_DN34383_c1_g1_i1.p1  ORF type:complete len:100 (+),score=2.53 TRINITY_DN34383_c1_g1_i1:38-337(+)
MKYLEPFWWETPFHYILPLTDQPTTTPHNLHKRYTLTFLYQPLLSCRQSYRNLEYIFLHIHHLKRQVATRMEIRTECTLINYPSKQHRDHQPLIVHSVP